ncbi:MAG: glycosyltransferase family 4 protein [Candidatus Binatia bacterium]
MKIALVHKRLELRGGTERVFYRTAEGLRDRGHEIHLFCGAFLIPPPADVLSHRVPHIPFPRTAQLWSFALMAPKVVERYSCDVVMSFSRIARQDVFRSGGGPHRAFLEKMMRQSGLQRRLWYRLSAYHHSVLALEQRQLSPQGCRRIIAVSEQGRREMIDYYRVPEDKVLVIHNGVDHTRFHPRLRLMAGKKIREKLGIPPQSQVVLFVGTGFRRKGLDRVLSLWRSPELQGIYLLVVGDDAKLSSYRRFFADRTIFFVGAQKNIEEYYGAADLFILPSTQEAFGNVVLEALASGLPVVTVPEVGATEKMAGELREGMLLNRDDPEEIKRKILYLLDRKSWAMLSAAARATAEKYSWENYFAALERELLETVERKAKIPTAWRFAHDS